jgi:septal ring factor EnvC (AmiA/AmiB activator)
LNAGDHNPATLFPNSRPNRNRQWGGTRLKENRMAMTEQEDRIAREREEIAARVASFKATQQKFEREREEYYATTLGNAWSGFTRPPFWD